MEYMEDSKTGRPLSFDFIESLQKLVGRVGSATTRNILFFLILPGTRPRVTRMVTRTIAR